MEISEMTYEQIQQQTTQQLLKIVDTKEVINLLAKKHDSIADNFSEITFEEHLKGCELSYSATIKELLSYKSCDEPAVLIFDYVEDDFDKGEFYYKVSLKSPKYEEEPPKNLKPYGGKSDDKNDHPEGHFNFNWEGYVETYGISGKNRNRLAFGKFLLTDAAKATNVSLSEIITEFLWELTFEGFLEKDSDEFWDKIEKQAKEIKEEDLLDWKDVKKELEKFNNLKK